MIDKQKTIGVLLLLSLVYTASSFASDRATNVVCDKCVGASDLADEAITAHKIKDASVSGSKLKNASVAGSKIKDSAITRAKIVPGSVTMDRLGTDVLDDLSDYGDRLSVLEGYTSEVVVDCSSNADSFLSLPIQNNVTYTLTGMCNGPIWIEDVEYVTIQGDGEGDKDDGVILPADLTEHPYGAIGIWNSTDVYLDNLTLSAEYYVSETYVFGSYVSALQVGNSSRVDVADVAFIGGDTSVDVYNASRLDIQDGVTVTGFNIVGLSSFNHSLLRTHGDITVTGVDGTSTEKWPNALAATNNSIIEIRYGGTFTAPTPGEELLEYPVSVWVGDNSTIRVRDRGNSSTFNGGVETGYMGMLRIDGDTTVIGVIGAYHNSYIRAVDLTQSGDSIWAGDGGMIRIEESTLSPTSGGPAGGSGGSSFVVYRSGKARLKDTTMNMAEGEGFSASGFSHLDLRGTTDLDGADISCHDSNQLNIWSAVESTIGDISCQR